MRCITDNCAALCGRRNWRRHQSFHRIAQLDWLAIPLMRYLYAYAMDQADQVPPFADAEMVASLRNQYRIAHLRKMILDGPGGKPPKGAWLELVGAAYDRRMVGFKIDTTDTQDDQLIRELNSRQNKSRFNLLFRNCADFARDIINFVLSEGIA